MPRSLFLHVGTHKTGSTSLQHFLRDHERELAEAGLGVVREHRPAGPVATNCTQLADAVLRSDLLTGARSRDEFTANRPTRKMISALRAARTEARRLDAPRLIVSSEALCFARTTAERVRVEALTRAFGARPTVLLCVRDVAEWRASWTDQLDKDGYPGTYSPGRMHDIRSDWYYDVDAITRFWSRVGELRVIDYDRAIAECGSIIPALLEATGTVVPDLAVTEYGLNRRRVRPDADTEPTPPRDAGTRKGPGARPGP